MGVKYNDMPKRKSKQQKELAQTFDARFGVHAPLTAKPAEGLPEPPSRLPAPAREIWREKARLLYARGALAEIDLLDLAAYCRDMAIYHEALDKAEEEGKIILFEQGSQKIKIINHWLKIADQAFSRALKIGDRFGFSPKARGAIDMSNDPNFNARNVYTSYSQYEIESPLSEEDLVFEPDSEENFVEALLRGWEPAAGDYKRARSLGWHIPSEVDLAAIREERSRQSTAQRAREILESADPSPWSLGMVKQSLWAFPDHERPAIEARLKELRSRPQR